jgi:hypothetical protein
VTTLPLHPGKVDVSLSALLFVQIFTLLVAIPLVAQHPAAHLLLDAGHLIFAAISVTVLTRHRAVQGALLAGLAVLAGGSILRGPLSPLVVIDGATLHEAIAFTSFAFNGLVTTLIASHVFRAERVTAHRVQGAILIYLNIATLFAITYGALETYLPGSIIAASGGKLSTTLGARTAALTYFSLSTITTTGFGDFVPVHPLARSLANLEAVFGQLFPATLLARLIALHLAHGSDAGRLQRDTTDDKH